tara:strand:+ start:196 stop:456 length:261 start_codon:yes stop_codon:yes gene_type:complete
MDINKLNLIIKEKISKNISVQSLLIEDKTFLHKNHKNHDKNKFHIKLIIKSDQLKKLTKIQSTKKIYKILNEELKSYIHSIQILLN